MTKPWKRVDSKYFGQPIGNTQDPDEIYDKSGGAFKGEGGQIGGMGSQGGGSKPAPQRAMMRIGSAKARGSYPRNRQKIRG